MLRDCPTTTSIRCADLKKQAGFYTEVLGLRATPTPEDGMVALEAGKGSQIVLYQGERSKADHTLLFFDVPKMEDAIRELEGKGVKFEDYDRPGLKTVNHVAESKGSLAAWFKDTEGNYLGLVQAR